MAIWILFAILNILLVGLNLFTTIASFSNQDYLGICFGAILTLVALSIVRDNICHIVLENVKKKATKTVVKGIITECAYKKNWFDAYYTVTIHYNTLSKKLYGGAAAVIYKTHTEGDKIDVTLYKYHKRNGESIEFIEF